MWILPALLITVSLLDSPSYKIREQASQGMYNAIHHHFLIEECKVISKAISKPEGRLRLSVLVNSVKVNYLADKNGIPVNYYIGQTNFEEHFMGVYLWQLWTDGHENNDVLDYNPGWYRINSFDVTYYDSIARPTNVVTERDLVKYWRASGISNKELRRRLDLAHFCYSLGVAVHPVWNGYRLYGYMYTIKDKTLLLHRIKDGASEDKIK